MMLYQLALFGKDRSFTIFFFNSKFRVSPDMKLHSLRDSIERLCGTEIYFPRDFIFLRSVGRCLTRVKQTQENQLKVKNYRPPQVIFLSIKNQKFFDFLF
jgi:hypothetical protein